MRNYEIRISNRRSRSFVIWASPHPSTYSAFCKARDLAKEGATLEVWRDEDCVHWEIVCRATKFGDDSA
jgi:hypothetical protein